MFAWLINVVTSDGQITEKERAMIQGYAKAREIASTMTEQWLQKSLTEGPLDTESPRSTKEARDWLQATVTLSLFDGSLCKPEAWLSLKQFPFCGMVFIESGLDRA